MSDAPDEDEPPPWMTTCVLHHEAYMRGEDCPACIRDNFVIPRPPLFRRSPAHWRDCSVEYPYLKPPVFMCSLHPRFTFGPDEICNLCLEGVEPA